MQLTANITKKETWKHKGMIKETNRERKQGQQQKKKNKKTT